VPWQKLPRHLRLISQPEVPEGVILVAMAGGDPEFKRIPLLGLRTDSDIHGHGFVRSFAMRVSECFRPFIFGSQKTP